MKIYYMHFIIIRYCWHVVIYLLIWHFKGNLCDDDLPKSTGPTMKYKLSSIKNPRDMYAHNSLSNIAVHMRCVNMHRAGHYQLEMACACMLTFLQLQWVMHCTGLIAFNCLCSKIRGIYTAKVT